MSVDTAVFAALMSILESKQPISASDLLDAMKKAGHKPQVAREAIQLAFERSCIRLDDRMRVVIVEGSLAAA